MVRNKVKIYFFQQDEEKISLPVEIFLDDDGHVENQQKRIGFVIRLMMA